MDLREYKICKASTEEWARYHAIYRGSNFNEWLPLSFQGEIDRYLKSEFCYWVMDGDKRIGGAHIKPNMLKCVFTIPPFNNKEKLIEALCMYVDDISDNTEEILVNDAEISDIEYYKTLGFNIKEINKMMIAATNMFEPKWEERYKIINPEKEHKDAMVQLYYETYSNNKNLRLEDQSWDIQEKNIDIYFNHINAMKVPNKWSLLIIDTIENKLVAACATGLINGLPYILDFMVHPEFQRKGIASNMIKTVMTLVAKEYPAIRLSVNVANEAEIFYSNMGFTSLAKKAFMIKNKMGRDCYEV